MAKGLTSQPSASMPRSRSTSTKNPVAHPTSSDRSTRKFRHSSHPAMSAFEATRS
jgi:hypothetical protein